jgi:Tol biopolymer transport system component
MGDLGVELEAVSHDPEGASFRRLPVILGRRSAVVAYGLAATIGALLAVAATWYLRTSETPPITRFVVDLPPNLDWTSNNGGGLSISPDGRYVAYTAVTAEGVRQLYLRPLNAYTSDLIARSDGAYHPFFSPDSRQLAFFVPGSLRRVAVEGGNPIEITSGIDDLSRGATWASDGYVYFGGASGVSRVAASGGMPELVTTVEEKAGVAAHRWPEAIRGHDAVLFTVFSGDLETSRIAFLSLKSRQWKVLLDETGYHARYVPTGHVVYLKDNTMMAVPFDIEGEKITGAPEPVLEGIASNSGGASHFHFSETGTLAYVLGQTTSAATRTLSSSPVWVDARGNEEPTGALPGLYADPVIAPNGTRVAMTVSEDDGTKSIRIWELDRRVWTVLTRGPSDNESPVWTVDGRSIVYSSNRDGRFRHLYIQNADGIGDARRLSRDDGTTPVVGDAGRYAASVSRAGRWLFFVERGSKSEVGALRLDDGGLERLFEGFDPRLSPDSRWLAYSSDESGSTQIFVRPFPVEAKRWTVSRAGAQSPRWSHDGRALYYRLGNQMMRAPVKQGEDFSYGSPEALFDASMYLRSYDLAKDDRRFLMLRRTGNDESSEPRIVLNWDQELKRLVPTK